MFSTMPTTMLIIAATCVVTVLAFGDQTLLARLIFWPPAVSKKNEYWRFVTSGFVHRDGMHLLLNMITLYSFGRVMEGFYTDRLGLFGFAGFYLSALVVSEIPAYLRHRDDAGYASLGASGAVLAVLFGFILLDPWSTILIFVVPCPSFVFAVLYLGYSIYKDRQGRDPNDMRPKNHSAHLWGALYGVVFTIAMEPRVVGHFLDQLAHPRFDM